ncbi:MAG: sulfopyruvate decarboxylase subunit alpha [Deltaproteobacteria bacterium]|nr:sulfopyruvate decarboxylase subunit alpha [Deltaproteobacteria bacterium]
MPPVSQRLLESLKQHGANFFVTVPCKLSADLVLLISQDKGIIHVAPTREEEGVGICAGAYLSGKTPVMVIQNSGIGNSANALVSLTQLYQIPLLLLCTHRGSPGERIGAQVPMGIAVKGLFDAIDIPYFSYNNPSRTEQVGGLVDYAQVARRPVAALLGFDFWREEV